MQQHHSNLALTYARSLLELADERDETEPVANDMGALRQILDENPTLVAFFKDPGISREERQAVLDRTLSDKANPLVMRFLSLMNERHRLGVLSAVIDAYESLLDEKLGKVEVDVTVAEKLADDELERVRQRVGEALKKDAVIHQYVDEEIIGGMILRVGDRIIDASVRRQLQAMKERMLRG